MNNNLLKEMIVRERELALEAGSTATELSLAGSDSSKFINRKQEHEQIAEFLELLDWYEQGMEDIPDESGELQPCPICGNKIDIEKNVYNPSRDWHSTLYDPDSGGDPININCECGLMFCPGTYDWNEFVQAWNRRHKNNREE